MTKYRKADRRPTTGPRINRPPTPSMARHKALRRKKAIRPWWYGFLVSVGLMIVLAGGAVGVFLAIIYTMSPDDPLEYYTPEEISRVYDRDGQLIGEFRDPNGEQRLLVRLEDVPEILQTAFLAIEDNRFYNHFGVDIIGIARAFYRRLSGGRLEGGSTITQQLARNVRLVGFEQTLQRKIKEAFLAVWIERHYSKSQILEFYLNQVPEGGQVYGVRMAAERYFSKSLDELTTGECATLAAIPKDPTKLNPLRYPDAAEKRRNVVLARMRELGVIDADDYAEARDEQLVVRAGKGKSSSIGSLYPYFVNGLEIDLKRYYRDELEQLKKELAARKQSLQKMNKAQAASERDDPAGYILETSGLRITSTIDRQMQAICEKALREGLVQLEGVWQAKKPERQYHENKKWDGYLAPGDVKLMEITKVEPASLSVRLSRYSGTVNRPAVLPFYNPDKAIKVGQLLDVRVTEEDGSKIKGEFADSRPLQGSLVVLDAHTAEVLAMTGGSGFASEQAGWVNQAMNPRLMGSCFKPFFYAAALERGFQPNDIIVDEPIEISAPGRAWRPVNYERDGTRPIFFGPNTLIEALEHSRNVSTVRLFEAVRISRALEVVRKFDFAYGYEQPQWNIAAAYPVCLGTVDCSPFVMASAYQVFANLGIGVRPQFIRTVADSTGRILFPVKRPEYEVIKPLAAFQTQYLMRQVVTQVEAGATGREVGRAFPSPPAPPICGKTGTTDRCRDAWFVGFTPDLVIVNQIGFDPWRPMEPGMTGGTTAAKYIWIPAVKEILKTRSRWKMTFDTPEEPVDYADICAATGKRASSVCGESNHHVFRKVPFAKGKAPKAACDGNIQVPVVAPMSTGSYGDYASLSPNRGVAHPLTGGYD